MYTNSLIEEYITEAYKSKAALNDADRDAAEKAFKTELTNGPDRQVKYGGRYFWAKVGSFDLDNFHKAYDKYFEENGLLELFDADGKLLNRGTYAKFKDLDKKLPAIKALGKLWGTQFNHDMEFLFQKQAREAEEAEKNRIKQERESLCEPMKEYIEKEINGMREYKALKSLYNNDLPYHVQVRFSDLNHEPSYNYIGLSVGFNIKYISQFTNAEKKNIKIWNGWQYKQLDISDKNFEEIKQNSRYWDFSEFFAEIRNDLSNNIVIKKIIDLGMKNFANAEKDGLDVKELFRNESDVLFIDKTSKEAFNAQGIKILTRVREDDLSWERDFGEEGIIFIDNKSKKFVFKEYSSEIIPIVKFTSSSYESRCYYKSTTELYFNSEYKDVIENSIGYKLTEYDTGNGYDNYAKIEDNTDKLTNLFDKVRRTRYEIDSGD